MPCLWRLITVFVLACLLAACGVRSAYNNLDWMIMRWVNSQVSLTAEQDRTVRQALAHQLQWHCATQLPSYVDLLYQLDGDVAADRISPERLLEYGETMADLGRQLIDQARPAIMDLMASLDGDQVEALLDGFAERNQELIEERIEIDPAERSQDQARSMERGMRRFLGRLNADQQARLDQWAEGLRPTAELQLAQRLAWQQQLADALTVRNDPDRFEERMRPLLTPGAGWDDNYREKMEFNRWQTVLAIADIHQMASERQINRLRSRLESLAADFERLTC